MFVCISDVLDLTELNRVRGWIADDAFVDGRTTAGYRAKRVKKNQQLAKDFEPGAEIRRLVLEGLKRNATFRQVALARVIQQPLISRYRPGMEYGRHVDDALMGAGAKSRTDLSVTVFLSDPGDYDGGELIIDTSFGEQQIKLPAGAAAVYPSGAMHRVAPVTRGERIAAVTWVQSFIRDPAKREILYDLNQVCRFLADSAERSKATDLAFKTYSNLLRRWSDV